MKKTFMALLAAASFVSSTAIADTLTLKDGSVIQGDLISAAKKELSFKTSFAGVVKISYSKILQVKTDEAVVIRRAGKDSQEAIALNGAELKKVGQLWLPSAGTPEERATAAEKANKPKWNTEASFNLSGKKGNSDQFALAGSLNSVLKRKDDKTKLYANASQKEQNGMTTDEEYRAGVDYERKLSRRFNWYARAEFEKDEFEDIALRSTYAGGLSYLAYESAKMTLRTRMGLFQRFESYESNREDESMAGIDFGINHFWTINEYATLETNVTYTPSFEAPDLDYKVNHSTVLKMPLGSGKRWFFQTGISNDYNNFVSPGRERLDTTYFSGLVLKFK